MKKIFLIALLFSNFALAQTRPNIFFAQSNQWGAVAISQSMNWWYSIYSVCVPNVMVGDLIEAQAESQFRNDTGLNVELAQAISIRPVQTGASCTGQFASFSNDLIGAVGGVSEPVFPRDAQPINGWNITPNEHYGRASKYAAWLSDANYPFGVWVDFRVRARSSGANNSGNFVLTSQANQGHMVVKRWRL